MTTARFRAAAGAALAVTCLFSLTACGKHGLSSSSTCKDFMNASSDAQAHITSVLAQKYNKPELATPLGAPEVPYECSGNPNETLGQLFQHSSG